MANQKAKIEARKRLFATRFKTELCRTFMAESACPYGPKCMFAHGEEDLRTEALNTAEGLTSSIAVRQWLKRPSFRRNGSFGRSGHGHSTTTTDYLPQSLHSEYLNAVPSLEDSPSYLLTGGYRYANSCPPHPMPMSVWRMNEVSPFSSPDRAQSMPQDVPSDLMASDFFAARSAPTHQESPRSYRHNPYAPVLLQRSESWNSDYLAT